MRLIFRLSAAVFRARPRTRQVRSPKVMVMSWPPAPAPIRASTAGGGPGGIGLATVGSGRSPALVSVTLASVALVSSSAAKRAMGSGAGDSGASACVAAGRRLDPPAIHSADRSSAPRDLAAGFTATA